MSLILIVNGEALLSKEHRGLMKVNQRVEQEYEKYDYSAAAQQRTKIAFSEIVT